MRSILNIVTAIVFAMVCLSTAANAGSRTIRSEVGNHVASGNNVIITVKKSNVRPSKAALGKNQNKPETATRHKPAAAHGKGGIGCTTNTNFDEWKVVWPIGLTCSGSVPTDQFAKLAEQASTNLEKNHYFVMFYVSACGTAARLPVKVNRAKKWLEPNTRTKTCMNQRRSFEVLNGLETVKLH